jgi:hypothetical protein
LRCLIPLQLNESAPKLTPKAYPLTASTCHLVGV